jgi:transaldolase
MGYFRRVQAETPTRFWINNPTPAETRLAIEAGATACTTNPTFAAKLIAADLVSGSVALAHRRFRLLAGRGIAARMLSGGARGLHHFTGMVGLDMDVTINWAGTADELERRGARVEDRSGDREPGEKLRDLVTDFRRAWDDGGLAPAEFADFGPVALFRGRFVDGWRKLLDIVRRRRGRKEAAR